MARLPFHHLTGADTWLRCDHDGTTLDPVRECVRLVSLDDDPGTDAATAEEIDAWLAGRGAAVALPIAPDACLDGRVLGGGRLYQRGRRRWRARRPRSQVRPSARCDGRA